MSCPVRICVVIPVYNHGLTVQKVVREAKALLPVIVVDDGSTDGTAQALTAEKDIEVITLPLNQGKGAALQRGFSRALEAGFTHAVTIDADGQHSTGALAEFIEASRRQPDAFIIGVRDFEKAGAPFARRASNKFSSFWFKFETGVGLADTQCGYRSYPLEALRPLRARAGRYAYELEIMVKAAWAGVPLTPLAVDADYAAATSRMSHFHPWRDMTAVSLVHSRLSIQAFFAPPILRKLVTGGELGRMPPGRRVRTVLRHLFTHDAETPARLAWSVGLGLFCGIAPIWGFQMSAAAALAHKLRLNKAIALVASNISMPPVAPLILVAGLITGHFLRTGKWIGFSAKTAPGLIPSYLGDWVLGSLALAVLAGAMGAVTAFLVARRVLSIKPTDRHD